ncbi:lytic transglycosylase domain-containing protein [Nonomuraea sp. NPDC005650]|uniref:aggregation-promoting factor C-terminal-like domain-containing protein n=1 Tax=Nonomuraea sp. NPDC005650 TaxID=3157045 RepID=UPI0033A56729
MRKRFTAIGISALATLFVLSTPSYATTPPGESQRIAKSLMPGYGWSSSAQFGCLVKLWDHVSGWRDTAGKPSRAYGIPMANPGKLMASAGSDWKNNARTQIKWGLGYIKGKYGTPCAAWTHYQAAGSY